MMQSETLAVQTVPSFKGFSGRIDLSAWISGASFAAGLWLAGVKVLAADHAAGGRGFYVMALAFVLFLASVLVIQRHMRLSMLANTFGSPKRLTTSGAFRYSRNPIYAAFFLPLASIAYFSLPAAIAAAALYILAMNVTVIAREERELSEVFGAEYSAFRGLVPRWLI